MKRSSRDDSPSLFDELEAEPVTEDIGNNADELDEDWVEVPQSRFLSWSHAMQLQYCYRRDLDAAVRGEMPGAEFFLKRAAAYKAELESLEKSA